MPGSWYLGLSRSYILEETISGDFAAQSPCGDRVPFCIGLENSGAGWHPLVSCWTSISGRVSWGNSREWEGRVTELLSAALPGGEHICGEAA